MALAISFIDEMSPKSTNLWPENVVNKFSDDHTWHVFHYTGLHSPVALNKLDLTHTQQCEGNRFSPGAPVSSYITNCRILSIKQIISPVNARSALD
jgi:hypothetical protein